MKAVILAAGRTSAAVPSSHDVDERAVLAIGSMRLPKQRFSSGMPSAMGQRGARTALVPVGSGPPRHCAEVIRDEGVRAIRWQKRARALG
jgi:hypothetical protein